jgi:hypothetical protein
MTYMDRINACAQYDPNRYIPFVVDGGSVGQVDREFARHLKTFADTFVSDGDQITLSEHLLTYETRTEATNRVLLSLKDQGLVPGWRNEPYPVGTSFTAPALFEMERAAVPLFGIKGYGVHLNGYVRNGNQMSLWVGKRSMSKPTGPGKLDQVVAGGQPAGMLLRDNLIKECAEEATIPAELVKQAISVGTLSYATSRPEGFRNDVLFNFDLQLPSDFTPTNSDGEVDEFFLWPLDHVCEIIQNTDDFKFNAALVVIDFAIRHGHIEADHPDYPDIVAGLHRT